MTKDRALPNCELDVTNNSRGSKIPKLIRRPDNMHICHSLLSKIDMRVVAYTDVAACL